MALIRDVTAKEREIHSSIIVLLDVRKEATMCIIPVVPISKFTRILTSTGKLFAGEGSLQNNLLIPVYSSYYHSHCGIFMSFHGRVEFLRICGRMKLVWYFLGRLPYTGWYLVLPHRVRASCWRTRCSSVFWWPSARTSSSISSSWRLSAREPSYADSARCPSCFIENKWNFGAILHWTRTPSRIVQLLWRSVRRKRCSMMFPVQLVVC